MFLESKDRPVEERLFRSPIDPVVECVFRYSDFAMLSLDRQVGRPWDVDLIHRPRLSARLVSWSIWRSLQERLASVKTCAVTRIDQTYADRMRCKEF